MRGALVSSTRLLQPRSEARQTRHDRVDGRHSAQKEHVDGGYGASPSESQDISPAAQKRRHGVREPTIEHRQGCNVHDLIERLPAKCFHCVMQVVTQDSGGRALGASYESEARGHGWWAARPSIVRPAHFGGRVIVQR